MLTFLKQLYMMLEGMRGGMTEDCFAGLVVRECFRHQYGNESKYENRGGV